MRANKCLIKCDGGRSADLQMSFNQCVFSALTLLVIIIFRTV